MMSVTCVLACVGPNVELSVFASVPSEVRPVRWWFGSVLMAVRITCRGYYLLILFSFVFVRVSLHRITSKAPAANTVNVPKKVRNSLDNLNLNVLYSYSSNLR